MIARPNPICSAPDLLAAVRFLLRLPATPYLESSRSAAPCASCTVIPGPDGWPEAFGVHRRRRPCALPAGGAGVRPILHVKLFHPTTNH